MTNVLNFYNMQEDIQHMLLHGLERCKTSDEEVDGMKMLLLFVSCAENVVDMGIAMGDDDIVNQAINCLNKSLKIISKKRAQ